MKKYVLLLDRELLTYLISYTIKIQLGEAMNLLRLIFLTKEEGVTSVLLTTYEVWNLRALCMIFI